MLILQRAPVLRLIFAESAAIHSTANLVLRGAFATVAAMGAVHSVAGATTLSPAAGSSQNPTSAKVGDPFVGGFSIIGAPKTPQSYEITGSVPPGILVAGIVGDTVNASLVTLSGTPTQAGNFAINIRAWNGLNQQGDGGKNFYIYTIAVAPNATSGFPPEIATPPQSQAVPAGSDATFSVTANADPAPTYQWRKNSVAISGAISSSFTLNAITSTDAGNYSVVVTNTQGSATSSIATLFVTAASPLLITTQPTSTNVAIGATTSFTVTASGNGTLTRQWYRHRQGESAPQLIPGATSTTLTIPDVQPSDMGFYFARISDNSAELDSAVAILTTTHGTSRLINLSTRGRIESGGSLTPGFVLRGEGNKPLIVRSVGPHLLEFGLSDALLDPTMDLIPLSGSTPFLTNNNWGDSPNFAQLASRSAALGAFPLNPNSLDAAVLTDVALPNAEGNTGYTVRIRSTSSTATGIAIAEVYDPQTSAVGADLINVSARGFSGSGVDALIPGFVIGGDGAKTMLIRVVGPVLAGFGVPDTMADPKLEIVPLNQTFVIAANDNWGGTTALNNAFATVGAFAFPNAQSKDAAVVVRLPPGGYTVRVTGANNATGVVLVEAYDLDP
jgi:hypothetical protein